MHKVWIAALSVVAAVAFAAPAAAKIPSPGNPCPPADTTFTVTAMTAPLVTDGFLCGSVHLVINASIVPTTSDLQLRAKTIQVNTGVDISNNFNSGSSVYLFALGGGIAVNGATIRANDQVLLQCNSTACPITIDNSVISSPIDNLLTTGDTRAVAKGDISITNSTFFGKQKVGVISSAGTVVWSCGGGGNGCQDPLLSNQAVALCGVPPGTPPAVFPCTVNFATADALRGVCFPTPTGSTCGGGSTECQVRAKFDIDLSGSVITCDSHFGVTSQNGSIDLRDAVITARTQLTFRAQRLIDATNSVLTSLASTVTLDSSGVGLAGMPCIIITGAVISSPNSFQTANGCLLVP